MKNGISLNPCCPRPEKKQTDVEHFEIKEPTLNEIFIREVGDSHE
ncbi:ABC-type uncharacterized transport system ATPase subunit [Paenibacillus brasilensis]|uniref:ABC-type uncharacterized transport system ATPase subunit n=1 Tax=Paenibacillus brasilensis TaxID=128574 RepID=A0ABU0L7R6_9BACL|nr:ABC-type uncharacterized transport system ATPase subunit [Paenibacillus brasilensis]